MKKSKGEKIDLLYINKNKVKPKKDKTKKQKPPKKLKKSKNILAQNEIMINIPTIKEIKEKKIKKNKKVHIKNPKDLEKKRAKKQIKFNKENKSKIKKVNQTKIKLLKWIIILTIFSIIATIFIFSKVFNIKEIKVENNFKIEKSEIIKMAEVTNQQNIFKISKNKIEKKLKENPYIESIEIKKSFNCILTIIVKERVPKYVLKFANALVYLNNQGYIIEISESENTEGLKLPMITGFKTNIENIKAGERLNKEDLERLETIIRIMESAKENGIENLITEIDILDPVKYFLTIQSELKTVNFGDNTYINDKIIRIKEIIKKEKNIEGIIFVDNINKSYYFREKV